MSRVRLDPAIDRLRSSRGMTESFLADLDPEDWFWQPAEGMNTIGWHVGHLAFAQYFLCLQRVRGRIEADQTLAPTKFLKRYKRESKPSGDPTDNFSPEELRSTFDKVFQAALFELEARTDEELDSPTQPPHPVFDTKLGAIEWCSQHELMHAGQIVLLRRLLGKQPKW